MIFIGDIACPREKVDKFIEAIRQVSLFHDEVIIANFEATFIGQKKEKPSCLYNDIRSLDGFQNAKKVIVSLANNHMYDYPGQIIPTVHELERQGVGSFGLVENDSVRPFEFYDNEQKYAFFGHCWRLYTHTNTNKENNIRVVDVPYDHFAKIVEQYVYSHLDTKVYCMMHWNYDLETLPFPMHVKYARHLIDIGVAGVVGSHSHVVQGGELYRGKPIMYGMGNFYLPSGIYFNGTLAYPETSRLTCGLWLDGGQIKIIWLNTDKEDSGAVDVVCVEDFASSNRLKIISPFRKKKEKEYIDFFRHNRKKKFLVPVFDEYKGVLFLIKERLAILRIKIIKTIKK